MHPSGSLDQLLRQTDCIVARMSFVPWHKWALARLPLIKEGLVDDNKNGCCRPKRFPPEAVDASDAGREVEVTLLTKVEGRLTPVVVKLSYKQASDLSKLLAIFGK
jgi:hypothetical protein